MQICGKLAKIKNKSKILYVSGEESRTQVSSRAKRLGITNDNILIVNETSLQEVKKYLDKVRPKFFILDSIQTTCSNEIQSAPGSVSQIREVAYEIMNYTKSKEITTFLIGHVTKEGGLAGPKTLEHMVDTVIYFEGDQFGENRLLRVVKNRFGNTNEVGLFSMDEGLSLIHI